MKRALVPRESVVSGRFYPGDPENLRALVTAYLAAPSRENAPAAPGDVLAVLAPHAGYVFSGAIAGGVLGAIDLSERLVVLGPNHTGRGAPLSVWSGGPWKTPLGDMPIDEPMREALINADAGFTGDAAAHAGEHSLEVLVPFFQVKNPDAVMTPITVSHAPPGVLEKAGEALAAAIRAAAATGARPQIIVSSDMSHYLPHDDAAAMDAIALEALERLDPEGYFACIRRHSISMCGVYPMTLALYALKILGVRSARTVAYATSGQTGRAYGADMKSVVGYAGVIFSL